MELPRSTAAWRVCWKFSMNLYTLTTVSISMKLERPVSVTEVKMPRFTAAAVMVAAVAVVSFSTVATADPGDAGLPPCNLYTVMNHRLPGGYIGSPTPQPTRAFHTSLGTDDAVLGDAFCAGNAYGGTLLRGTRDMTLAIPPTASLALPPGVVSQIVGNSAIDPGQTMTVDVDAAQIPGLNGTATWGICNRTGDVRILEVAMFVYTRSAVPQPIGAFTSQNEPFFILVRRANAAPMVKPLDPALLTGRHTYSIRLDEESVTFFVDNENVGTFDNPPTGKANDILGLPLPLVGTAWVEANYWGLLPPLPQPEPNSEPHSMVMTNYRQGPIYADGDTRR